MLPRRPRPIGRPAIVALLGALAAAAAYTLASPPRDVAVLAWLAPALLLLPATALRGWRAALPGLLFGSAIAFGITRWAVHASLAYFGMNAVAASAFATLVWVVYGGLPYALLTLLWSGLAPRTVPALRPVLAAWLWVLVEMLRTRAPLALPWGLLSHTQWQTTTLIQIADLGGAYAVTFVVVLLSVALGDVLRDLARSGHGARRCALRAAPTLAVLALALGYGVACRRAAQASPLARVAVVQGDFPNAFRWRRSVEQRNLTEYLRLTSSIGDEAAPLDLIVWPENAVGFYLDGEPVVLGRLGALATRRGSALLVGAPRLAARGVAHNSAWLIGADGSLRATYDKQLLVPFAEGSLLPIATDALAEPRYAGGTHSTPLATRALSLGTPICFEVLFPDLVRAMVRDGANLLVNLSNDSWLDSGDGAAPRQHFAMAVLRAVETRRALVRASAGGVSGLVGRDGQVAETVPWGSSGVAVGTVALADTVTPYVRFGDVWVAVVGIALVATNRALRRFADVA